jgi:hypothetical protein
LDETLHHSRAPHQKIQFFKGDNFMAINETEAMGAIQALKECIHKASHCAGHDIREGMTDCALLCLDCVDICTATLGAMTRHSPHHGDFAKVCAHICRECAAECKKHDQDHCKECAAACEKCASECEKHASESHA